MNGPALGFDLGPAPFGPGAPVRLVSLGRVALRTLDALSLELGTHELAGMVQGIRARIRNELAGPALERGEDPADLD